MTDPSPPPSIFGKRDSDLPVSLRPWAINKDSKRIPPRKYSNRKRPALPQLDQLEPEFIDFKIEGISLPLHRELAIYHLPFFRDFGVIQKKGQDKDGNCFSSSALKVYNCGVHDVGVGLFIRWAYTQSLQDSEGNYPSLKELVDLAVFAEQWNVPDLQDDTLKNIVGLITQPGYLTKKMLVDLVRFLYQTTSSSPSSSSSSSDSPTSLSPTNPLRRYIVKFTSSYLTTESLISLKKFVLPKQFWFDLAVLGSADREEVSCSKCELKSFMVGEDKNRKVVLFDGYGYEEKVGDGWFGFR